MRDLTISIDELTELGAVILREHGLTEADAQLVARSLAVSDAWGHPSHGMLRLSWYVERLRSGVMDPSSSTSWIVDAGALGVLDGADGVGQVVTERACASAVERAKLHGVGLVAVRDSNHFGTAAYWTRRMAEQGVVAMLFTNGSPAMAPWGGRHKTVGANPWSIAVPGGVVLDIANTGVARGKIYAALQRGEQIPDGWAIDADGAPTNDPRAAIEGILLPMAGHKGYGISFMMDVVAGVLTGSGYAEQISGPYVPDARSRCGHLAIAIDIDAVIGREQFDARLADLVASTKAVPLASGVDEVFVPGELEDRALERAERDGVRLPGRTVEELERLAAESGVRFPGSVEVA